MVEAMARSAAEVTFEGEEGARLVVALNNYSEHLRSAPDSDRFRAASEAIDNALAATIKHMKETRESRAPSIGEDEIARLWQKGGQLVREFDPELANACMMKGLGWIDPDVWTRARQQGLRIGIDEMQDARMQLNRAVVPATFTPARQGWFQWIKDKDTRDIVSFVGTGLVVILGALWTAFVYFDGKTWIMNKFGSGSAGLLTYYVCTGEFPPGQPGSLCNPNVPWQPCYTSPVTWAKNAHSGECVTATQKTLSDVKGNRCGYTTYEVACSAHP